MAQAVLARVAAFEFAKAAGLAWRYHKIIRDGLLGEGGSPFCLVWEVLHWVSSL